MAKHGNPLQRYFNWSIACSESVVLKIPAITIGNFRLFGKRSRHNLQVVMTVFLWALLFVPLGLLTVAPIWVLVGRSLPEWQRELAMYILLAELAIVIMVIILCVILLVRRSLRIIQAPLTPDEEAWIKRVQKEAEDKLIK